MRVTLSGKKERPKNAPSSWLAPQISGHSLHFIESRFTHHEALGQSLARHFGAVQFQEEPMTLREISPVLIRDEMERIVNKQVVSKGLLGESPEVCPLPGTERHARLARSNWSWTGAVR